MNHFWAWVYVVLAAFLETGWAYSMKYLHWGELRKFSFRHLQPEHVQALLPLSGYIFFGITNVYFLSLAMKTIPTTTAFTVWMALSVLMMKLIDMIFLSAPLSWQEIFFLTLIMAGVIGLRLSSTT